jgi:hypothetical protein
MAVPAPVYVNVTMSPGSPGLFGVVNETGVENVALRETMICPRRSAEPCRLR